MIALSSKGLFAQQTASSSSLSSEEALEIRNPSFAIRPIAWLSTAYDSNVFYEANPEPTFRRPNDGVVSFIGGGLKLENREKQNLVFTANLSSAYRYYLYLNPNEGVDNQGIKVSPISQKAIDARNTIDNIKADIAARLLPLSTIQFHLTDLLNYIERPIYDSATEGFKRLDNRVGLRAHFIPGGDKVNGPIDFNIGYGFRNITFLNNDAQTNTTLNPTDNNPVTGADPLPSAPIQGRSEKIAHDFLLSTKFKFLPKNYLLLDIKYVMNDYALDSTVVNADGSTSKASRDSTPFSALIGISGLLTSRIAFFMKVGYGNTYNATGNSYSGFLALTEFAYVQAPKTQFAVGYQRDAQDMGVANFYVLDRFYLRGNHLINQTWAFNTNLSFDIYAYDTSNALDGRKRTDPILRSMFGFKQKLMRFYSINYGLSYESNFTDYVSGLDAQGENPKDYAKYQRYMFTLTLQLN
jgi:hypothetical protein